MKLIELTKERLNNNWDFAFKNSNIYKLKILYNFNNVSIYEFKKC